MLDITDFEFGKEIKIKHGNSSLKELINIINKYAYSEEIHQILLALDAFSNNLIDSPPKVFNINYKSMKTIDLQVHKLMQKINITYLIEKYLVYEKATGLKRIDTNEIVKATNIISRQSTFKKDNLLNELFFYLSYEQFSLQDNIFIIDYYRIVNIFQHSQDALKLIEKRFGLDIFKLISLHYMLVTLIFDSKTPSIRYSIKGFKNKLLKSVNNITEEEIDIFLNNLLITNEEFKNKHLYFRYKKNSKGDILLCEKNKPISMNWEEQSPIDRSFPKISYSYPLLLDNNETMILTSYTALKESLKLERYIREINLIPNFRGNYFGPLLEKYIGKIFTEFYKENNDVKIYGNEQYYIRKDRFDAPDVIIETKDYIIFIESKTSAFNLEKALKNFSDEEYKKYFEDIEKSSKNIQRYLDENSHLKTKKIYKFISFIVPQSAMVSSLPNDKKKIYDIDNDLIITDLNSLEALTSLFEKDIIKVIDSFITGDTFNTLYHFCQTEYGIDMSKYEKFFETHKILDFKKLE